MAPRTPSQMLSPTAMLAREHDTRPTWRFHVLIEITNFAALRRHVGRPRADLLCRDVIERLTLSLPDVRMAACGHAIIELDFEGDGTDVLRDVLTQIREIGRAHV